MPLVPVGADGRYEFPKGFHMARLYPVEGESAIAELWFGEAPWAQVALVGVNQNAVADARTTDARFIIDLYPPPEDAEPDWWRFDLTLVEEQLDGAKKWLLENEAGRVPLDRAGLTAAGSAYEKMGRAEDNEEGEE